MPEIRVQDEQGLVHVFPEGSTPEMINEAMGLKPAQPAPPSIDEVTRGLYKAHPVIGGTVAAGQGILQALSGIGEGVLGAPSAILGMPGQAIESAKMLPALASSYAERLPRPGELGRAALGVVGVEKPEDLPRAAGQAFAMSEIPTALKETGRAAVGRIGAARSARSLAGRLVEDTVDRTGRGIKDKIHEANKAADANISETYDAIGKTIDKREPGGAIDASEHFDLIDNAWKDAVKINSEIPGALKKEGGELVSRTAEPTPGRWGWEQTKQIRSEIGDAMHNKNIAGPRRAVLAQAYKALTEDIDAAAKRHGLLDRYGAARDNFKELLERQDQLLNDVYGSDSGPAIIKKLNENPSQTRRYTQDLKNFGLDTEKLYGTLEDARAGMEGGKWGRWWTRYIGGGLGHYVLGLPWISGALAGGVAESYMQKAALRGLEKSPFYKAGEVSETGRILKGRIDVSDLLKELNTPSAPAAAPPSVPTAPTFPFPSKIARTYEPEPLRTGEEVPAIRPNLPKGPPDVRLEEIAPMDVSVSEAGRRLGRIGAGKEPSGPSPEWSALEEAATEVRKRDLTAKKRAALKAAKLGGSAR